MNATPFLLGFLLLSPTFLVYAIAATQSKYGGHAARAVATIDVPTIVWIGTQTVLAGNQRALHALAWRACTGVLPAVVVPPRVGPSTGPTVGSQVILLVVY